MPSLSLIIKSKTATSGTFLAATSDVITSPGHCLKDTDTIRVSSTTTLPAGLTASRVYYVRDATASTFKVAVTSGGTAVDITDTGTGVHTWKKIGSPWELPATRGAALQYCMNLLRAIRAGAENAAIDVHTSEEDGAAATATATLVSCATDTITIAGVTFTGSGTPSGDAQFETDGDDTADAAALVAKVNAHPTLSRIVLASNVANVVTFTVRQKGYIGNFLGISETGSTITVTAFSGGTGGPEGAASTFSFGK